MDQADARPRMTRAARHAVALWVLLGLFCVRVAAQLIAAVAPLPYVPSFDQWASGALPYPALVAAQISIIVAYAAVAHRIGNGSSRPSAAVGRWLLAAGAVYFATMAVRLLAGLTVSSGHWWFDKPLPSFFHLVLASFLIVAGRFHGSAGRGDRG